jgi:hypothetical protein
MRDSAPLGHVTSTQYSIPSAAVAMSGLSISLSEQCGQFCAEVLKAGFILSR